MPGRRKGSVLAKRRRQAPARARREVPIRVQKHIARLALSSTSDYVEWCQARGFRTELVKSWSELQREWLAHSAELTEAHARRRADRDPGKLLAAVCAGQASSRDVARPRWRMLATRIESADLDQAAYQALRLLVEIANRRGKLLLAEGRFGEVSYPFLDGLIALSERHGQWIRKPQEWRPRSHNARRQFNSLARHLLTEYPVPGFLDAAWLRCDDIGAGYRSWFVRIGRGENIRDAESPVPLTNRLLHHFLRAPEAYGIEQALRWGQVHSLGGDARLVEALLGTRIGDRFDHEAFWVSVIRFFIEHPWLDRRHVGPIVDYLHNERFAEQEVFVAPGVRERRGPPQPNLSMRGRSVETLLRQVERWHRELARSGAAGGAQWEHSAIGEFELETGIRGKNLRVWRIRELLSAAALSAEGRAMRHCVASYSGSCASGHSSIWAMEVHGFEGVEKRQTIEVRGDTIVQCRGRFNKLPSDQERQMLVRWAEQESLQLSRFVRGA